MEDKLKKYKVLETVLLVLTIVIGVITIIDIFLPDPIFMLDEAALASITGLLTFFIALVEKKEQELKDGEKSKMKTKDIEEITTKVTETANAINKSRKNK